MDYSFMKTGYNNVVGVDKENCILNIQSMLYSFVENATKKAEIYINHGGRNSITKDDLQLSMKAETFEYLKRENIIESIDKWRNIIKNDELEEGVEDLDDLIEKDDLHKFKKNNCSCEICDNMNTIEPRWIDWNPSEGIETILKNAINEHF